jgi:Prokaryotic RING finger family 1
MDRTNVGLPSLEAPTEIDAPRRRARLPRWLGIVFPALVAAAAGFAAVFSLDRSAIPVAVVLATPVGLGLTAGAVARWSMPGRPTTVRWLVAMAAITVGLLTVGLLTGGAAGVLPGASRGTVQWAEIGELVAGGMMAALALTAWRRPTVAFESQAAPAVPGAPPPTLGPGAVPAAAPPPRVAAGPAKQLRRAWDGMRRRLRPEPRPRLVTPAAPRPSRRRRGRSDIRLTGAEEHRCPYCLSPVTTADPRGVVICPVCHTPHHADCWAITGTCQVPHAYGSPS